MPVVWRYDMLRSQARQNADRLLYYKTDTHWNAVAQLIGLDGIFEALDMPTRPADSYPSRPAARPPVTWQTWRRSTPVCPPRRPT